MKKKILSICLVVALLATGLIGATLAYFQDTAANTNTMEFGSVNIKQHEYQRVKNTNGTYEIKTIDNVNSYELEDYENDKPLLPVTEIDANGNPINFGAGDWDSEATVRMTQVDSYGSMDVFTSKNAQDKFVTVENTGKSAAYVRTLVAIEVGDLEDTNQIRTSYHQTWNANALTEKVEIKGSVYMVSEYVYKGAEGVRHDNGVLPAGDVTYPNLSQVYLTANIKSGDVTAIDKNENGKLDILVLSQAVQAAGFDNAQTALDTAFGDVTAENVAAWFNSIS